MPKPCPESDPNERNHPYIRWVGSVGGAAGALTAVATTVRTLPPTRIALLVAVVVGLSVLGLALVMVWQTFTVFRDTILPKVCRVVGEWLIERIRSFGSKKTDDPPKVDEPAETGK